MVSSHMVEVGGPLYLWVQCREQHRIVRTRMVSQEHNFEDHQSQQTRFLSFRDRGPECDVWVLSLSNLKK